MTRAKQLALTAALTATLAAGGCGSGGDAAEGLPEPVPLPPTESVPTATETSPSTTTTTETQPPETDPTTTDTETTSIQPPETGSETPGALVIRVEGGKPVGGVQRLEVQSGERVRFVVKADAPEEVHVHAYDLSKPVGPGQDASFNFQAKLEGVFEVELENAGVEILELSIKP